MPTRQRSLNYVDLKRPTIFAHRGSSAYAPENTLAAFELALDQGADAIELDVKLSVDGHVVVMHDDTVDRTTDGTGRVKSMSLKELMSLDAGSKFPPNFKPQKIPTLADVFQAVGGKIFINVELTNYMSPHDDLPDRVISLVRKHNLESKVMLSSFNIMALIMARNLLPMIPLAFLAYHGEAEATIHSRLIRFGPLMALHPAFSDVTNQLLQRAHGAKSRVHTYTVDKPEIMQQLITQGVDGIFTNDPVVALRVLADYQVNNP